MAEAASRAFPVGFAWNKGIMGAQSTAPGPPPGGSLQVAGLAKDKLEHHAVDSPEHVLKVKAECRYASSAR